MICLGCNLVRLINENCLLLGINFFSNGQLDYKGSFKNGKKEGIWVGYYLDGQLRFKGRYKNGKRHGRWETKTKYGQKKRWQSGMFKNDIRISD